MAPDQLTEIRKHIAQAEDTLWEKNFQDQKEGIRKLIKQIDLGPGSILIKLHRQALVPPNLLQENEQTLDQSAIDLRIPFQRKRRGVESKIIIGGSSSPTPYIDQNLINILKRSHTWWATLTTDPSASIKSLANQSFIDAADVTRFLPLAFLAPDIVEAILNGRQPVDLTVERMRKLSPIPSDWSAQRRLLGINT